MKNAVRTRIPIARLATESPIFLPAPLSYAAVLFHRGHREALLRYGKLATSSTGNHGVSGPPPMRLSIYHSIWGNVRKPLTSPG